MERGVEEGGTKHLEFQLCGTDDVWLRLCQNGVTWQPTKTYQRAQTSHTHPSHPHSQSKTDTCACAHPLISPPNGLSNSGSQPNLPHVTHTQSRKGVAAAVCRSGGVVWSRWAPHCAVCCAKGLP